MIPLPWPGGVPGNAGPYIYIYIHIYIYASCILQILSDRELLWDEKYFLRNPFTPPKKNIGAAFTVQKVASYFTYRKTLGKSPAQKNLGTELTSPARNKFGCSMATQSQSTILDPVVVVNQAHKISISFCRGQVYYQLKQCTHTILGNIRQKYNTFALFDPLNMGNFMIPVIYPSNSVSMST